MKSVLEKTLVVSVAAIIGFASSKVGVNEDFLWSIRGIIIPVLIALFSLYSTMSITLVKTLDSFSGSLRGKAMSVLSSIKFELRYELCLLFVTFLLIVLFPILLDTDSLSTIFRCVIDGLIIVDVAHFVIIITDTFFSYLDLVRQQ